uniref:Uncharacterized protein n=1 Tax=Arundo donax TaxID=35708 RepID=A0A0A9GBR8_ARUDO
MTSGVLSLRWRRCVITLSLLIWQVF